MASEEGSRSAAAWPRGRKTLVDHRLSPRCGPRQAANGGILPHRLGSTRARPSTLRPLVAWQSALPEERLIIARPPGESIATRLAAAGPERCANRFVRGTCGCEPGQRSSSTELGANIWGAGWWCREGRRRTCLGQGVCGYLISSAPQSSHSRFGKNCRLAAQKGRATREWHGARQPVSRRLEPERFTSRLLRNRTRRVCRVKPASSLAHEVTNMPQSAGKSPGT